MSSRPVFLDVDSTIIENNLLVTKNEETEELNKLFDKQPDLYPTKLVKPTPGFCIKSREEGTDTKVFVNICQTDAIPAPKDISEKELIEILNSEDEISSFRVPMSIGDVRTEVDQKGGPAKACDIAINPKFFQKVESIQLFKTFLMAVVFEGLKEKHKLNCTQERILLKNRKAYGTLQMHRIQQRELAEKMGFKEEPPSWIQEIKGESSKSINKPMIEELSSSYVNTKTPQYRLFKKKDDSYTLFGEFKFPDIASGNELTLDVGEDRIILESNNRGYLLDIFIPCFIDQEKTESNFNKNTKILTVTMPIIKG